MTPLRRTVAIVGSVAVALLLVSCGVDAGDAGPANTTTPSTDLSPSQQAAADQLQELYEDFGIDPEDAECLAEGTARSGGTFDPTDTGALMDIVNQCDISMSELNDFSEDQGLGSMEDGIEFGLEASLKAAGLTDDQAACVAKAYVDEFGTDVTAIQDPAELRPFFEGCDVDTSLLPGG